MRLAQLVPTHHGQRGQRPANLGHRYSEGWAWVRVRGAFFPDLIEAQAGERLRVVFRREETAACSEHVVIPSLGKSVMLPPFEDVAVELDPLPPGEHEFTCGLGALRGRILARDDAVSRSVVSTEPKTGLVPGGGARGATHVSDGKESQRRFGQMKRPNTNITPVERLGRVLIGLIGVIGGLILLGSAGSAIVAVQATAMMMVGMSHGDGGGR
jgi:Uncharacterized protein conserved in bacteria